MYHNPIVEVTQLNNKDRFSVCFDCGNDVESWQLKNNGEPYFTAWGHKKDTKNRTAYSLVNTCPAWN